MKQTLTVLAGLAGILGCNLLGASALASDSMLITRDRTTYSISDATGPEFDNIQPRAELSYNEYYENNVRNPNRYGVVLNNPYAPNGETLGTGVINLRQDPGGKSVAVLVLNDKQGKPIGTVQINLTSEKGGPVSRTMISVSNVANSIQMDPSKLSEGYSLDGEMSAQIDSGETGGGRDDKIWRVKGIRGDDQIDRRLLMAAVPMRSIVREWYQREVLKFQRPGTTPEPATKTGEKPKSHRPRRAALSDETLKLRTQGLAQQFSDPEAAQFSSGAI